MKTNFVSTHLSDRLYFFFFWYGRGGCDVSVLWDNPCHAARTDCTQRTAEEEGGGVCLPLHPPPRPPPQFPLSDTHLTRNWKEREGEWLTFNLHRVYVCTCERERECGLLFIVTAFNTSHWFNPFYGGRVVFVLLVCVFLGRGGGV